MTSTRLNIVLQERQIESIKRVDPNVSAFIRRAIDEKLLRDRPYVSVDFPCSKCRRVLVVKWAANLGFGVGGFFACPACGAKHEIPDRLISVEVKNRKSSLRFHCSGQINARAIAREDGRYLATVSEPEGKNRIPKDVVCHSREEAEHSADSMVQSAYPHDCQGSECSPWEEFAN